MPIIENKHKKIVKLILDDDEDDDNQNIRKQIISNNHCISPSEVSLNRRSENSSKNLF